MRRRRSALLVSALLVSAMLLALALLPLVSPIDPVAYRPVPPVELAGPWAPNRELRRVERVGGGRLQGPEDVAVDAAGNLYCGLADGTVRRVRLAGDRARIELVARTDGRPLGLDFDAEGRLWIAAAGRGLLSVDRSGFLTTRAASVDGAPIRFANDVDVGPDGRVYFSDASDRFESSELVRETLEARPHGRLLVHDAGAARTRLLLDGLYFANGVAVAADASFVVVAETFRYRLRRLWLSGPLAGRDEVWIDHLPGFPDGISATDRGTFWVALYALRSPLLDRRLHPHPWWKRLVTLLPPSWLPGPRPYGLAVELDADGRPLRSLHDPGGEAVRSATSAQEAHGSLWLGSVEATSIARYRWLSDRRRVW